MGEQSQNVRSGKVKSARVKSAVQLLNVQLISAIDVLPIYADVQEMEVTEEEQGMSPAVMVPVVKVRGATAAQPPCSHLSPPPCNSMSPPD